MIFAREVKKMPQSLFDFFPIDLALERSSIYLNQSVLYSSRNLLSKNAALIGSENLNNLQSIAQRGDIVDAPLSWFGKYILGLLSSKVPIHPQEINFIQAILGELTSPGINNLGLTISHYEVGGLKFSVPLDLEKKLNPQHNWNYDFLSSFETLSDHSEYENWKNSLSSAVSFISSADESLMESINKFINSLLVVKSQNNCHGSGSPSHLIGSVYLPAVSDTSLIAECLVHEALHNYLYRLDHVHPLFIDNLGNEELYYSPWRKDPRPLMMVLHGAFVFTGVVRLYNAVLKSDYSVVSREIFMERIGARMKQIQIAIEVLSTHDHTSKLGSTIIEIMNDCLEEVSDYVPAVLDYDQDEILMHQKTYSQKDFRHIEAQV